MEAIQQGVSLRRAPQPAVKSGPALSIHDAAMNQIRGGVSLRSVPPPVKRRAGEDKVVDVASELRQKMLKQRKQSVKLGLCLSLCLFSLPFSFFLSSLSLSLPPHMDCDVT